MIRRFFAALAAWIRGERAGEAAVELPDASRVLVRVPRSVMYELRRATAPTESHAEPLAFLRVRFASEQENGVVIGIGVIPFPHDVYVDGYAGANFDTTWAVETANAQIRMNAGVLLAHQHGGRGKPDFSGIDRETNHDVMLPLATGVPYAPYGAVVLSNDSQKVVIARHRRLVEADLVVVPDALGTMDVTA